MAKPMNARPVAKKTAKKTSAKKTAAKQVPKRSPSYGMSIEDYAKKLNGWQQKMVLELVGLIREVAPKATGSIKWAQPVFEHQGPFAFIKPAKAHVTFGFWRGAALTDADGLLTGGDRMKHLKIASGDAVPRKELTKLIREAIRLNEREGDPTKRTKG